MFTIMVEIKKHALSQRAWLHLLFDKHNNDLIIDVINGRMNYYGRFCKLETQFENSPNARSADSNTTISGLKYSM